MTRRREVKFSPLAFYNSRRQRGELVTLDDSRLVEAVLTLPRKRLVTRFGSWSGRRRPCGGAS